MLGDEQERAEGDEEAEDVDGERGAERERPEERQIDQRIRQLALSPNEHDADGTADGDGRDGEQRLLALGDCLIP